MKTEQERIDYLANRIREFNILVSGQGEISGGFGELPPIGQGDITLDHIEDAFSKFRLTGNNGIQAAGSLQHGYTLFIPPAGGATGFPPNIPAPPPTPTTGACCVASDCSIETESACTDMGGTYQGDDVPCDPNPCISGGACCFSDGNCIIETFAECIIAGGAYLGDGTNCSPNPCSESGACCTILCFYGRGAVCSSHTGAECASNPSGGTYTYFYPGVSCETSPCCIPGFGACPPTPDHGTLVNACNCTPSDPTCCRGSHQWYCNDPGCLPCSDACLAGCPIMGEDCSGCVNWIECGSCQDG